MEIEKPKIIVVVAGTAGEFRDYVKSKCMSVMGMIVWKGTTEARVGNLRYVFPSSVDSVRGLRSAEFVYTGSYIRRPDLEQMRKEEWMRSIADGRKTRD